MGITQIPFFREARERLVSDLAALKEKKQKVEAKIAFLGEAFSAFEVLLKVHHSFWFASLSAIYRYDVILAAADRIL